VSAPAIPIPAPSARRPQQPPSPDPLFPFSAVLGQDDLRLALILNAIHPAVGGLLARGEKGTAKSTLVRALAAVLPPVAAVAGCRFSCDPAAPDPACPDGPHGGPHDCASEPSSTRSDAVTAAAAGAAADAAAESAVSVDFTVGADADAGLRPARLVELPVGASEDRLTGSLDLERVLGHGIAAFQPGLLAAAHRGLLYVDEVNLLPDHLVDVLLDAAAMGVAHVERDGVSVRHAARFILVGTMNPEEGELRPQLLDRFGLTVEVAASRAPKQRAEIVRRRLAFEADPAGFAAAWAAADREVGERIAAARAALPAVELPDAELERIARVCAAFEVDGMRADLVTARAAVALAAWSGRSRVTAAEIREAARLALPHRRRRNPFDAPGLDEDLLDQALADEPDPDDDPGGPNPDEPDTAPEPGSGAAEDESGSAPPTAPSASDAPSDRAPGSSAADSGPEPEDPAQRPESHAADSRPDPAAADSPPDRRASAASPAADQPAVAAAAPYRTKLFAVPGVGEGVPGRRSAGRSVGRGRTVGSQPLRQSPSGPAAGSLHLPATVRASAVHQRERGRSSGPMLIQSEDLHTPIRRDREANLVLFVVDASGSMAARARMATVKGAVLSLLLDAYQRRDKVGLITFRGEGADVALPPTGSVEVAAARLQALPTGGRTPLAAGLACAAEVLRRERLRDPRRRPLLVLVTDGRATAPRATAAADAQRAAAHLAAKRIAAVVVDCESGPIRLGLAAGLAAVLGAEHVSMTDLAAHTLEETVRGAISPASPTRKAA
jgi:magnesium chelatase subunit D